MAKRKKTRQSPSVILWSKREQLRHSEAVEKLVSIVNDLAVELGNLRFEVIRLKGVEGKRTRSKPVKADLVQIGPDTWHDQTAASAITAVSPDHVVPKGGGA